MRRIGIFLMACTTLALGLGCDDGRDPDIMLMDSGPGGTDSGTTPEVDSGTTPEVDAGGDGCPPVNADPPMMPMACEADTLTCLMGAGTAEAQQACVDADANPEACDGCILQDIIYSCTADAGGCAESYGEYLCCLADECGSSPTEACINMAVGDMTTPGPCAGDANTFFMCINSAQMARSCGVSMACFQSAGGGGFLPDLERDAPMSYVGYQRSAMLAAIRYNSGR